MYNRDCFWKPFASEHVNESQKLLKSAEKHFHPTFSWFWGMLSLKKLILIRSDILRLFVNMLTANSEYSRSNRDSLPLQIQTKLSAKTNIFLWYFPSIFSIYIKFKMFWKKHERHGSNISEVIEWKRCAYLNA